MTIDNQAESALPATIFEYLNLTPTQRQELFLATITETSHKPDYWVDMDVSRRNAAEYADSIDGIDALIGAETYDEMARRIAQNPSILRLVPPLLGIRKDKFVSGTTRLKVRDAETLEDYELDFGEIDLEHIDRYARFVEYSGLGPVLRNKEITGGREALLAVEWAMSVSGRKNRSGKEGEQNLHVILNNIVIDHPGFEFHDQSPYESIREWYGIDIGEYFKNRTFDGSLYGNGRLILFETNIFNGGGSKVRSVVNDFVRDAEQMRSNFNTQYVYLTDGLGWITEHNSLLRAIESLITINYEMVRAGYLDQLADKL